MDHPPCFKINLTNGLSVEVRMSKNYPDELPELRIHRLGEEVSSDQAKDIEKKLTAMAKQMLGSEMIYELIEEAKQLLQRINQTTSFHSEMLQRQEEQANVRYMKWGPLLSFRLNRICRQEMRKRLSTRKRRRSRKRWRLWRN